MSEREPASFGRKVRYLSSAIMGFSENFLVTEKLSNVRSFLILRSGEGLTSFNKKITMLTLLVTKSTMKFSVCEKTLS